MKTLPARGARRAGPALATLRVAYTHPTLGPVEVAPVPTFAWAEVSSATIAAAHGDVPAWKGTATGGEKVLRGTGTPPVRWLTREQTSAKRRRGNRRCI